MSRKVVLVPVAVEAEDLAAVLLDDVEVAGVPGAAPAKTGASRPVATRTASITPRGRRRLRAWWP